MDLSFEVAFMTPGLKSYLVRNKVSLTTTYDVQSSIRNARAGPTGHLATSEKGSLRKGGWLTRMLSVFEDLAWINGWKRERILQFQAYSDRRSELRCLTSAIGDLSF